MNSREKKLKYNTISSLILQFTTLVCGFILPRIILGHFGSEINGLVNSIAQFLQMIAFLELGVGAVVSSSLYKPLSEKNSKKTSEIYVSAANFFRKLAIILAIYVIVLIVIYPHLTDLKVDWIFTTTLILAMSISNFAQYYYGIVDRLLLTADQKGYINYNVQTITLILNNIACIILIRLNCSIQIVKLTTSLIYLIRPIILRKYVNNHYEINRKIKITYEPIKQKWNGVAQHIAAIVLDSTDNIVLTIFSSLENVSIYSVYYIVVNGMRNLFSAFTAGIQSLMGNLWACEEYDELKKFIKWYEWLVNYFVLVIFICTGLLIAPFVSVYTKGINDANYVQPLFGMVISLANATYCLRSPYITLVLAAGHYKETQRSYIIATLLNIVSSILLVKILGLFGVALGTFISTLYQTVWLGHYCNKKLINFGINSMYKNFFLDCIIVLLIYTLMKNLGLIVLHCDSYFDWLICALKNTFFVIIFITFIQFIFNKNKMFRLIRYLKLKIHR